MGVTSVTSGVRDRLGQALFERVAGPEGPAKRDRIHYTEGPRWFDGDSPIAVVHGDASMFIGGIRALLLQTLHPAAMLAVSEHSGFRGDMWGRLHRTSEFLATTTFATAEDAQRQVDIVQAIHRRVVGTMPDGSAYAASDPHLLRWVHVAEVDSFLRAHTVYGKQQLDQGQRDDYVAQVGTIAARLGATDLPGTEAELGEVMASYRPELRGTAEAREAVRYLLFRPPLPLAARPAYGVLVAAAVGLMPAWTRVPLRLPWLPVTERTVVRAMGSAATGTIRWAMTPPD
ncbi:oxygenase MpaB family protein [Nocardioides sp.]|uniref:oxygenase MpaB family protein n=1 Tax=Nocardioides sp. TaxID=35761 RepID=UPI00271C1783|nr:oxygenase MpaB family protein [Nocardioides sp.]MDO9456059.1 oxygenase MpaB family protein [Nocardioides sp.]